MSIKEKTAYLQHGRGGPGPFRTEQVPIKENLLEHHKRGLSYTASGYGVKIPTGYMVKFANRWRRVYCRVFSNSGTLYIVAPEQPNGRIIVQIEG